MMLSTTVTIQCDECNAVELVVCHTEQADNTVERRAVRAAVEQVRAKGWQIESTGYARCTNHMSCSECGRIRGKLSTSLVCSGQPVGSFGKHRWRW